jgi:hypothetical protein
MLETLAGINPAGAIEMGSIMRTMVCSVAVPIHELRQSASRFELLVLLPRLAIE